MVSSPFATIMNMTSELSLTPFFCRDCLSFRKYLSTDNLQWHINESDFVKQFAPVDSSRGLSKTLAYNFDIGRAKLDSRFHQFWDTNFKDVATKSNDQIFKVSLNFVQWLRRSEVIKKNLKLQVCQPPQSS